MSREPVAGGERMEQGRDREFADALRDAVEARGLSLERIRAHLLAYGHDVSVATLSYRCV